jgi:hypothetical protein
MLEFSEKDFTFSFWQVAEMQQIIFRAVAGSHQLQFYAICMRYPQIACNTNHVLKYRRGIII